MSKTSEERTVILNGARVPYQIVRNPRLRRIRLVLTGDGPLRLEAPPGVALGDIRTLLTPHAAWIVTELDRQRAHSLALVDGASLPFCGGELTMRLTSSDGRAAVQREGEMLLVAASGSPAGPLEGWYRRQARVALHEAVHRWSTLLAVEPKRITIRDARTRWGSCSQNGNLNFSWRLILVPPPVLEYVVIHELMHLRELNHGPRFWAGVERFCPEYRQHIAYLRANGPRLAAVLGG